MRVENAHTKSIVGNKICWAVGSSDAPYCDLIRHKNRDAFNNELAMKSNSALCS